MAERVKVKLNYKGVGQLLKSSEMQQLCLGSDTNCKYHDKVDLQFSALTRL